MRLPLLLGEHGQLSSGIKFNILYLALNWESPPVGIALAMCAALC